MKRTSLLSLPLLVIGLVLLVALERRPVAFPVALEGVPAEPIVVPSVMEIHREAPRESTDREIPGGGIAREALRAQPGKGILIVRAFWKDDSSAAGGVRLWVCPDSNPFAFLGPTTPLDSRAKERFSIRLGSSGISEALAVDPGFVGIQPCSSYSPSGGRTFLAKGEVRAGGVLELDVRIAPAVVVRGKILDARGAPIPDALLHSTHSMSKVYRAIARSREDGSFRLHLQERHEWFFASAPGRAASRVFAASDLEEGKPFSMRLARPGRDLHGRLCTSAGGGVGGIRVYADYWRFDVTNGDGRFTLVGVPLGRVSVGFLQGAPISFSYRWKWDQAVSVELGPEQPELLQVVWKH